MNSDRFRLVYSQCLDMFVPVSETTKAQGRKSSGKRMRSRHAVTAALFSISYSYNAISAPPVNALPTAGVIAAGVATINVRVNTNALTVNQASQNAIINWGSFNIGSQASVDFKMPNSTSQVLNRVSATGGLSQIYGKMTADGQVYLINPNGILFGSGAQVNVNSLVASSLNISDNLFNKGYLSITDGTPAFNGTTGYIQVDAGAQINAATGGKILMFAPDIKNNGLINTPDGQTLLAAGQKIYLTASVDANLRGLLVEIDNGGTVNNGFTEVGEDNKPITEKVNVGQIIAERGNVTLAGIAVNQNGRVKATTSVSVNGSIRLQAQDTTVEILNPVDGTKKRVATVAGDVTLGKNSTTEVLPDYKDKLAVADAVAVSKSKIAISGKNIHLMDNAMIIAPSGDVNLTAKLDPSKSTPSTIAAPNTSRIYFESGSGIDVSGVGSGSTASDRVGEKAAQVSVASNVVLAELRATELRDSPLQRTGILYKAKVYADSRATGIDGDVGTSVADVSGYTKQVTHGLSERLATGGSVNVVSEGDIVFKPTATINVSGGKVDYTAATVNKTRLLAANGQTYDIANSSKELTYVGIQNVSLQEQGYTEGKNAGSVAFIAPAMVLEGKLSGATIVGERQRTITSRPIGATLQVGDSLRRLQSNLLLDASHQAIAMPLFGDSLSNEQQQTLLLGANFTAPSGFKNLLYYADGQITVKNGTNIAVNPGGNITLNGGGVNIQSNLTAHAGTINVSAKEGINNASGNVVIGSTSTLDASGLWTNDKLNLAARDVVAVDGGKINISASSLNGANGDVILDKGSVINASGGAWINSSGKLKSGKGGDIKLLASDGISDAFDTPHTGKLKLDGTLRADSLITGGSLSLSSGSVTIGNKPLNTIGETVIDRTLFEKGGFTSYDINGFEGLTLADDTSIAPVALTRVLDSGFSVQQSGTDITNFSHLALLPATNAAQTRKATNLSLSASSQFDGKLSLGLGSTIVVDPSSSVNLLAKRQLTVLGNIIAPAGNINITSGVLSGEKSAVTYKNDQTLWLGEKSVLDVSGIVDSFTNTNGFKVGSVKDAGTIKLNATKGEIVAEAGAQVKMNGAHAVLDVKSGNSFIAKDIASKGGSLIISAREGILWDATMNAKGGNETVAAGNLTIALPLLDIDAVNNTNAEISDPADQYPIGPREIVLKATGSSVPVGLKPNDSIDAVNNGIATIFVDKLQNAGFDNIQFAKSNNIRIAENLTLTTRGSLTLDTPNVIVNNGVKAILNASFVGMGNSQGLYQESPAVAAPVGGTGTLAVNAESIDLFGKQSLSGVGNKINGVGGADFISKGDIQLRGVTAGTDASNTNLAGGLQTAGDTTFSAKRIYPSTLSNYTLSSTGTDSTIAFKSSGADSGVPFSVLGTLNVEAANITQDGVLRAPFGVINLKATDQLTLGNGSLTSVSAEGKTLPFGTTINGKTLNFDVGDGRIATITALPDKNVSLDAKSVNVKSGSKIDISGGGDLTAYEFTTGTGGSDDVLAASDVFAVMPDLKAGYMAGNSESYSNSTFKAGDSIYLSGGNGLAAGNYVLLPAHYALLPGGYSVKAVAGTQDFSAQQNISNKDGSMLVSGYRTQFGGITADSRSSGFVVASGNVARTQSEYTNTLAGKFFSKPDSTVSGLRLPADAGRVAINAVTNLAFDGVLITNHANTARGAEVSISSDKVAISGDVSKDVEAGYLKLSSDKLNAIGAESLTIGAKTIVTAKGTQLNVTASNVKLVDGASLTGQEITLAATDTVSMAKDTSIKATGVATKNSGTLIIGNADTVASGDGALLRVSTGAQPDLVRNNVSQEKGSLDIKTGAKVSATGAIIADATKANSVNGEITLAKDGAIRLGAPKISFGTPNAPVSGLLLDNSKLTALGSPSNIQLKSYSTIDFYGTTTVGDANLKSLTLEGAGLAGFNNAGNTVTLTADTFKFANPDNAKFESTDSLGSGTLTVNAAKEIGIGSGTFGTAGFETIQLKADQVMGEGKGGLSVKGDLLIDAGRITAEGLSDQTIKASKGLVTTQHDVTGLAKAPLGGKLTLEADTITHGGKIDLTSGNVTLKALGKAGGDSVILLKDSQINARGSAQLLGTVAALADAGTINVQTTNGNIRMDKGAIIDVSATGGAAAGAVVINTSGTAGLAGTLNGLAAVGNGVGLPKQGSFALTASSIPSFAALNSELERGNFNQSRNIHVAKGDITVTDKVTARNVTLTTDDGNLTVAGTIDASGDKGGIVKLNAGQQKNDGKGNITLASTAKINASATFDAEESAGSKGDGGKVLLNSTTDSDTSPTIGSRITAETGSEIDVSGKGLGGDGQVTLRAPRLGMATATDAGNGIAVDKFKSTVKGANASIVAEGVKVYKPTEGIIDDTFVSVMKADNLSYLSNADAIKTSLGADKRLVVSSGDEVRSTGNITLASDIDLHEAGPGTLTLRAKNNIDVNGSISAGFTKVDEVIIEKDKKGKVISTQHIPGNLTTGGAWTYQITAGSDLHSADVLVTNNVGTGNFTLAADKSIRTGTGDINIATGGDFNLSAATSTIYTAGEADTKDYSGLGSFNVPTIKLNYGTKSKPDIVNHTATYTVNGGDIILESKGNINGADTVQLPADWLLRLGSVDSSTGLYTKKGLNSDNPSWSVFYANFKENIGALGGGNININAGGSINDLSAVIATNGRVFGTSPADGQLVVNGGGDLTVKAGGDILGGVFMVDKGVAEIRASGGLQSDTGGVKTVFAIGDAAINVATLGQLNVLTAFNPTSISSPALLSNAGAAAVFSTYSSKSALNLTSVASGVEVSAETPPNDLLGGNGSFVTPFNLFPSSLNISALGGDLNFSGDKPIGLWPSALGDLTLATRNNLLINAAINMSDESPALLPSAINPTNIVDFNLVSERLVNNSVRNTQAVSPLHQADPNPVVIYAGNDIITSNATLNLSKRANITAGHDLVNLSFLGQNLASTDVTTITAGNDILYTQGNLKWGGPGYVDITAGRNIGLGAGDGFVTRGNLDKAYLPDAGASLSVLVGAVAADDSAFIAKYLNPAKSTAYSNKVTDYVKNVTGNATLTNAEAWIQFQKLDTQLQHQFVQSAFFNELKQTIDGVSKGTGTYKPGFDAIATYFPKDNYDGKLDLSFSQIKTERGGDLNVMAPGGSVVIGLPKTPRQLILEKAQLVDGALKDDGTDDGLSKLLSAAASKLGMVTVKGGDVNVFSKGNIDVAQSRQFTIEGGDIVDWSSEGDIDAGKGSKTAVSAPPPLIRTDAQGNTFTDLSGTATGSGIATLDTKTTTTDLTAPTTGSGVDTVDTKKAKRTSNIYFGAPKGTVNAGDAGIRAAGNLSVAAQRVQGADNISVGGNSSGVPAVTSVNISFNAPASADSNAASKQGDQLGSADKLGENSKMANLLSLINVEVISLGDESTSSTINCKDEKNKDSKNKKECQP